MSLFLICTKRIERFDSCIPSDWGEGYDNVIIAVTCENQAKANERMPKLLSIKAKHKQVLVAPNFRRWCTDGWPG